MFDFQTKGDIEALITKSDGTGVVLRLRCATSFKFPRQGEMPATLAVICDGVELTKGLTMGASVTVTGTGACGEHDWEKPTKFGQKPSTKAIQNYYFKAKKIELVK